MIIVKNIKRYGIVALMILCLGCRPEYTTYQGDTYIMFSSESHTLPIMDSEEWFEIPISATRAVSSDLTIGVEVVANESSAIEDREFVIESDTVTIPAGELTTAVRIKGISEAIPVNSNLTIKLRLVLDQENVWEEYGTDTTVTLQRCCPMDINAFTGYAVLTSTWCMQYMNTDSRLVRTSLDPESQNRIIIEDMYYEGYDIALTLNDDDPLNPIATMGEEQVVGATGEAFGTIYGNGKLMMTEPAGYTSYYSTCEGFVVLYSLIYVDGVGSVGTYVNIIEWISDDEAERIMREGF